MKKVLVVDDEAPIRGLIRRALSGAGYEVIEAPDGKVAVRLCQEHQFDLVITDIFMPEKEGLETIIELRRDFPGTRIIAITGGGSLGPGDWLAHARKFGANYTVEKPFSVDELIDAVAVVLED